MTHDEIFLSDLDIAHFVVLARLKECYGLWCQVPGHDIPYEGRQLQFRFHQQFAALNHFCKLKVLSIT
jgi:hypothetical protein